ncbi:MAG: hypothetical protein EOO95_05400 [Pedobacter sp.]|nr:MAG: hypothetical protein EOO95_05400 [Pedobacter sp.]
MNIEALTKLRDKCLLFNEMMKNHPSMLKELIPAYEKSDELIHEAFLKKRISRLQAMSNDIDEQVLNHMSSEEAEEFKSILKERFDIDYDIIAKKMKRRIAHILKKRKINSFDDYELIKNRVEAIYDDPACLDELNALNALLLLNERSDQP